MESLKFGYINYNTRIIPEFCSKEPVIQQCVLSSTYIKSENSVCIQIGGLDYTLDSGEHFIPFFHTYHEFRIKSDISTIEVYINCLPKEKLNSLYYNYIICTDSIKGKNEHTICKGGLYGSVTSDELYELCTPKIEDLLWFKYFNCYHYKDKSIYTYSTYIYHDDIHLVQVDTDVTQYLVNWDKKYVRQSCPPCIAIEYNEQNYEPLKSILKEKYNIKLDKSQINRPFIKKFKSYEELSLHIKEQNTKLKEVDFVTLQEVPFTQELYNSLKEKLQIKEYEDIPLSELDII